jgi:hypothetical protein
LLFKVNRFSGLFPIVGSQIITEPRSLEDFPGLERTSYPTDAATLTISKVIASNLFHSIFLTAGRVRTQGPHPALTCAGGFASFTHQRHEHRA